MRPRHQRSMRSFSTTHHRVAVPPSAAASPARSHRRCPQPPPLPLPPLPPLPAAAELVDFLPPLGSQSTEFALRRRLGLAPCRLQPGALGDLRPFARARRFAHHSATDAPPQARPGPNLGDVLRVRRSTSPRFAWELRLIAARRSPRAARSPQPAARRPRCNDEHASITGHG
jgi:hypothetical protein